MAALQMLFYGIRARNRVGNDFRIHGVGLTSKIWLSDWQALYVVSRFPQNNHNGRTVANLQARSMPSLYLKHKMLCQSSLYLIYRRTADGTSGLF